MTNSSSFRGKDGRWTEGGNLSLSDLRSRLIRLPGGHLVEGTLPRNIGTKTGRWLIPVSRVPQISSLFSAKAASIKQILWAGEYGYRPERIRRTCNHPRCLNPHHHEEITVTPGEMHKLFFQKAYEAAEAGREFILTFPTEGQAIQHRQKLNAFRRRGIDEKLLPETWDTLTIRLRPEENGEGFQLYVGPISDGFEDALAKALGLETLEGLGTSEPSALDLLEEDFEK